MNAESVRVAYFGTSDRSIPVLDSLNQNFELVLCITKADTVVGRNREKRETEVKKWAKSNNKALVEIANIKEDKERIINALKEAMVEIGVVADFSFILPEEIINTPKYKLINIHFSLLPKLRGASPVQFAILQGFEKTGITYYVVTKGMDNGPVLHQVDYNLHGTETAEVLWKTLFALAAENLTSVIRNYISGKTAPAEQNETQATYTYSPSHPKNTFIYKEDAEIDWKNGYENIWRGIRAYTPWPIAWTTLEKLESSGWLNEMSLKIKPDKNKNLKVKVYEADLSNDKKLVIKTIQVEGSKKISWDEFKNGYLY